RLYIAGDATHSRMTAAALVDDVHAAVHSGHLAAAGQIHGHKVSWPASNIEYAFVLEIETKRLDGALSRGIDPKRRFDIKHPHVPALWNRFGLEIATSDRSEQLGAGNVLSQPVFPLRSHSPLLRGSELDVRRSSRPHRAGWSRGPEAAGAPPG